MGISETQKKMPRIKQGIFCFLVARGGIEPPTQGFSIPYSTERYWPFSAGQIPQNTLFWTTGINHRDVVRR